MSRLRVAVLYGGRSAEHEVSVVSARHVIAAMDPDRYEAIPVAITKAGRWLLPERGPAELDSGGALPSVADEGRAVGLVRGAQRATLAPLAGGEDSGRTIDVVFPVLHGPFGEDGTVQGLLEMAGIPYVGSGVAASAIGMDKDLQKRLWRAAGHPVVPWIRLDRHEFARAGVRAVREGFGMPGAPAGLPVFTKPARLGSSIGIARCRTEEDLAAGLALAFEHGDTALVEQAVSGRELECAVLGNEAPEASVVGEVVPAPEHDFYDYEAKYLVEGSALHIPADVPGKIAEEVRSLSVEAFRAIGAAGMARVDFFYDEAAGDLFLNEINTIPGFTPISMYPKLWSASGIGYGELIDRLIALALERRG